VQNAWVTATFDVPAFLAETGRPAQVAAVSPSGVPLLGSLWYVFAEGRFWFSSLAGSPLPRAAERGSPVAVLVDDFTPPQAIRQVRVRGAAQIEPQDPDRTRSLYARYLGPDEPGWPEFFRRRLTDERWLLWSVWPDSGLAVSTPQFRGDEYRWRTRDKAPMP
jgi:hypothetical protein